LAVGRDKKNENENPNNKEIQRGPRLTPLLLCALGGAKRDSRCY